MDNKKDLAYLISDEGKRNLIDVIVGGIEAYACYCSSCVEKNDNHSQLSGLLSVQIKQNKQITIQILKGFFSLFAFLFFKHY